MGIDCIQQKDVQTVARSLHPLSIHLTALLGTPPFDCGRVWKSLENHQKSHAWYCGWDWFISIFHIFLGTTRINNGYPKHWTTPKQNFAPASGEPWRLHRPFALQPSHATRGNRHSYPARRFHVKLVCGFEFFLFGMLFDPKSRTFFRIKTGSRGIGKLGGNFRGSFGSLQHGETIFEQRNTMGELDGEPIASRKPCPNRDCY